MSSSSSSRSEQTVLCDDKSVKSESNRKRLQRQLRKMLASEDAFVRVATRTPIPLYRRVIE